MRRAKTTLWALVSVIIIFLIVSIIIDNERILIIPLFLILFGSIVFQVIELKILSNKIKPFFTNNDYFGAIDYLDNKLNKCFVLSNEYSCAVTLVITYMLVGDTEKARKILDKYKRIKNNKNLLYIQMIILISDNKIIEARQYKEKLFNLNSKKYGIQKVSSNQIFEMIETNIFDENLYNTTKYPLLESICLRIKNDEFQIHSLREVYIIQSQKKSGVVRLYSILLNILTYLTLFFGLIIVATISESYNPITSMDGLYYGLKTIWVFLLFIPLSIGCIVFGLMFRKKNYKTTSNVIIGTVLSVLLFGFGIMHFLGLKQYNTDTKYLINLGEIIHVDFPSDITLVTQDWTKGKQTSSYNNYYKYTSVVRFNNDTEILSFKNNLNYNYWIEEFSDETNKFLPIMFTIETSNYDKFLLYCFETNEYNPKKSISKYNYLCIAYSEENNSLIIYEFTLK